MKNLLLLALMPAWIILCIVFHELGHYLAARKQGLRPTIGFDNKGPYIGHEKTSQEKTLMITKAGVLLGYAPLIIPLFINTTYGFFMILAWTIGNVREIKKLLKTIVW